MKLLVKIAVFTILVPGSVTVWIPYFFLSRQPAFDFGPFRWLAIPPLLVGAAFYFWCAWDFAVVGKGTPAPIDPPKALVTKGLYRIVRNPMYVGVLLVLLGEAVLLGWMSLFWYVVVMALLVSLFVILVEEPLLKRQFGPAYEDYCRAVPRWIPRLRGSKGSG